MPLVYVLVVRDFCTLFAIKIISPATAMATYVEGEAPETDSEDEQYLFNLSYLKVSHVD